MMGSRVSARIAGVRPRWQETYNVELCVSGGDVGILSSLSPAISNGIHGSVQVTARADFVPKIYDHRCLYNEKSRQHRSKTQLSLQYKEA